MKSATGASIADFAQHLIGIARKLYQSESMPVELDQAFYALDSTTIDLCLSVFPWAHFRKAKAAVKMHTLLDLRGNIPTFIYISDGKLHDVNVLDVLPVDPGSIYVMDKGYVDFLGCTQSHNAYPSLSPGPRRTSNVKESIRIRLIKPQDSYVTKR